MGYALRLAFSFFMLWTAQLYAETRIKITKGVDSGYPISVIPFQWHGPGIAPGDVDVGNIIAADLRNSGKFNLLDSSHLPQKPNTVQEVQSDILASLGINAIVIGQVIPVPNGSYSVAYQLVDTSRTAQGTVLAQNSYKVQEQWLRYAGHAISNEVFEKLTGIKGAFCTRIAYIVQTDDNQLPYELRVSDYDGYNQFTIYRSPQPLMSPSWSPDGSRLAYVTFESGCSALVIQTLSNGTIHKVASFPRHNGAPAFSPDGTKLAFALSKTGSLNLYVMDINSGKITQVTNNRNNNTEPAWFPDNQNLVFTSDQSGRPQIYKVNINNHVPIRITWEGLQNQDADISTDGKIMVMVNTVGKQQHIAKQDLVTGDVQILSSTFLDETPSLAPNGTMVIYSSSNGMNSVLNLISTDGRFKVRLPATDGQVKFPAWSPYL